MNKNTVTPEEVKENMQDVIVRTVEEFGKPTTYVTVQMKNGFTLRESTTCVDPANYNENIGKEICLKKIEDKVWLLRGYALQERLATGPILLLEKPKENLSFGEAIEALKKGERVARKGWNGKGMFLWLKQEVSIKADWCKDSVLKKIVEENGGSIHGLGTICMLTAQREILTGWSPNQLDILSEDWVIL